MAGGPRKYSKRPSIDRLAVDHLRDVPRFLQALERYRYVILDRENLPRVAPTPAEVKAAARELAREERAKAAAQARAAEAAEPDEHRAAQLLVGQLRRALRAHHLRITPGRECPVCATGAGELGEFSDR